MTAYADIAIAPIEDSDIAREPGSFTAAYRDREFIIYARPFYRRDPDGAKTRARLDDLLAVLERSPRIPGIDTITVVITPPIALARRMEAPMAITPINDAIDLDQGEGTERANRFAALSDQIAQDLLVECGKHLAAIVADPKPNSARLLRVAQTYAIAHDRLFAFADDDLPPQTQG